MDLVERYVYAVTKELPEKQRADIKKELETHIDDMMEQYDANEPIEIRTEKVLTSLGDPTLLAENYRGTKRYLIGPQNYDNYISLMKIVLGAVFLGVSIAVVVGSIFSGQQSGTAIITDYLSALFSAMLQAFAWVTVIFAIAEYKGVKLAANSNTRKEAWSVAQLPTVPKKETTISPWESVFSILFITVFMSILYFSPQLIAVYIPENPTGQTVIPIFNAAVLSGYSWLFAGILVFNIAKEAAKLISRRWTLKISVIYAVLSLISTILAIILFSDPGIWNPSFSVDILKHLKLDLGFVNRQGQTNLGILLIILIAGIADIASVLFKGIRYAK